MKIKIIIFSLTVFIATGILSACNSSDKKTDGTQENKDSLSQSMSTTADTVNTAKKDWEKFKAGAENKIRQNEDSIQVFKKIIEKKGSKIKAKYDKQITRLEEKNNEMKAKLEEYKDDSADKWQKFKTDFNNTMDTLGTDIKDFFKNSKK